MLKLDLMSNIAEASGVDVIIPKARFCCACILQKAQVILWSKKRLIVFIFLVNIFAILQYIYSICQNKTCIKCYQSTSLYIIKCYKIKSNNQVISELFISRYCHRIIFA